MSDWAIWFIIAGLTLVTIATRSSFLVLGERVVLPARVQHALRYAPACALTALVAPELFLHQSVIDIGGVTPKLVAGIAAALAMLKWRSMMIAMVAGMAVFQLLRLF